MFFFSAISAQNVNLISELPKQPTETNSILIKILPSNSGVPTLPSGVLKNQIVTCENSIDKGHESRTRGRNLRKIIPKIIIDKC